MSEDRVKFEEIAVLRWEWSVGGESWDPLTERWTFGRAFTLWGAKRKAERYMKKRERALVAGSGADAY